MHYFRPRLIIKWAYAKITIKLYLGKRTQFRENVGKGSYGKWENKRRWYLLK